MVFTENTKSLFSYNPRKYDRSYHNGMQYPLSADTPCPAYYAIISYYHANEYIYIQRYEMKSPIF